MLVAKARRQPAPFAAMFSDVQDSVEHLLVRQPDVAVAYATIATLYRQVGRNTGVLNFGNFHSPMITRLYQYVLNRPDLRLFR